MMRGIASRVLLALAALLMLFGGMMHGLAFRRAAAALDASGLSRRYVIVFGGLWWSDAAVVMLVGLAYLILAFQPGLGTRMTLGVLVAVPLASAISIYSTAGNFAPAHLLMACAIMALIAALLHTAGTEPTPDVRAMRARHDHEER